MLLSCACATVPLLENYHSVKESYYTMALACKERSTRPSYDAIRSKVAMAEFLRCMKAVFPRSVLVKTDGIVEGGFHVVCQETLFEVRFDASRPDTILTDTLMFASYAQLERFERETITARPPRPAYISVPAKILRGDVLKLNVYGQPFIKAAVLMAYNKTCKPSFSIPNIYLYPCILSTFLFHLSQFIPSIFVKRVSFPPLFPLLVGLFEPFEVGQLVAYIFHKRNGSVWMVAPGEFRAPCKGAFIHQSNTNDVLMMCQCDDDVPERVPSVNSKAYRLSIPNEIKPWAAVVLEEIPAPDLDSLAQV